MSGGGPAAARTIGVAADIVATVARASRGTWAEAPGIAAQAVAIADRCPKLAVAEEKAWHAALVGLGLAVEGEGDGQLRDRLEDSVELPVVIAETGADVADLAAAAARLGEGTFRSDAVSAALLAHAGVRVARHL